MNANTETVIENALTELDKVRDMLISAIVLGLKDATNDGEQAIDFDEAIDSASSSPLSKIIYDDETVTVYDIDGGESALNGLTLNELDDIAARLINNDYGTVDKEED